jgi:ubiquinone/menaquinone biosynthesis C-methylase UbiE
LNNSKANFFDSQVEADWARADYGPGEIDKINRMLRIADARPGMRVLEPGCGTGRLTLILARLVGSSGHVLALDISTKMVEVCRERLAPFQNTDVYCAALEQLSVEYETFDLVVCHNVFPHFDHKPAAVAYLASALKMGGKLIVFHFMNSAGINDLHRKAHPSVLNDLLPEETEMRRIFESAGFQIELLRDNDSGYLLSAIRIQ